MDRYCCSVCKKAQSVPLAYVEVDLSTTNLFFERQGYDTTEYGYQLFETLWNLTGRIPVFYTGYKYFISQQYPIVLMEENNFRIVDTDLGNIPVVCSGVTCEKCHLVN